MASVPASLTVSEKDGTVNVCVTLSTKDDIGRNIQFKLSTRDGTGTFAFNLSQFIVYHTGLAGSDYFARSLSREFRHGSSNGDFRCVDISILDDNALEGSQEFFVILITQHRFVRISAVKTTIIITDDDS